MADLVPFYPLYALLFADSGLSGAQISALFALWSGVGLLAEVPTGVLADRFSRRGALVAASALQAAGYCSWILFPTFAGFALGFVLWGLGGSFASGAREALLFDGLKAVGAQHHYAQINGWVVAAGLIAELPTALLATWLFSAGGYATVGWASVGGCLAAGAVAMSLPEPSAVPSVEPRHDETGPTAVVAAEPGYVAAVRAGISAIVARPAVRSVVAAAALLGSFDALEEYFPLITAGRGVSAADVPLAMLPIAVAGAVGAALGGRTHRLGPVPLAVLLGGSMVLLGAASLIDRPIALLAVAIFYGLYRAVLVVLDARVQERIDSASRATVTSVVGLGVDLASFGVYAAWSVGDLGLVAASGALLALALPRLLRPPSRRPRPA